MIFKKYKFYFYDVSNKIKRKLTYDVDEWKDFGITYGRTAETSIVKSHTANFTFIKDDAFYLKNIVTTRGFNTLIRLDIYSAGWFQNEKIEYKGYLDLTDFTIEGNTFKCPLYSGGFFTTIENCWSEDYEITDKSLFENITFTGGGYEYKEQLGINKDENSTVVSGFTNGADLTSTGEDAQTRVHYLPILRKNDTNEKLTFFETANFLNCKRNTLDVGSSNCFIISADKINGGRITIPAGKLNYVKILGLELWYQKNLSKYYIISGIPSFCMFTFSIYLYNAQAEGITWRPSENILSSLPIQKTTGISLKGHSLQRIENGTTYYDYVYENIPFGELTMDLTGYLNQYTTVGYYVAIVLENMIFKIPYQNANDKIIYPNEVYEELVPSMEISFDGNFAPYYTNDNFIINKNKIIHGISAKNVFLSLIEKINTKYTLDINTVNLENYTSNIKIASGIGLLGSLASLEEAEIDPILTTSLSDFTEFLYVVYALRFCCIFNKESEIYSLSFTKIENTYNNTLIQELVKVNDIVISSDRDNLYTSIVIGYDNEDSAIFGALEFNTKNTFKTGNTELEANELELVSPYNAGVMDIETYIHENYENFEDTDNGSDSNYILEVVDNVVNTLSTPDAGKINSTFNLSLTPKRLIINHEAEFASYLYFDKLLTYLSSEGNSDFIYQGITENENYTLANVNYTIPFLIEVEVPAIQSIIEAIDKNPFGYFKFIYNGNEYKGYVQQGEDSLEINPMNEKSSVLKLIAHKNSKI